MQVQEIMSRQVDVIDPNTTIRDAARRLRDDNVGALPSERATGSSEW